MRDTILRGYVRAQQLRRDLAHQLAHDEDGALNTQFVLLAGIGAVIAIALGFLLYQNVIGAAENIDMDFNQIGG